MKERLVTCNEEDTVQGIPLCADLLVSDEVEEIMLGINWLTENRYKWHFVVRQVEINGERVSCHVEHQVIPNSPSCNIVNFCSSGMDSRGWYYEICIVCIFNHCIVRMTGC